MAQKDKQHATQSRVIRLECQPNDYPWGEVGNDSLAAVLSKNAAGPSFKLDPSTPYAELWMGTHPKSPSKIWGTDTILSTHLATHLDLLGDASKFPPPFPAAEKDKAGGEGHVPFLFKILTCKQALPLQIHPDKELAEKLHKQDPEQFPDTNHKPEIAVCLSDRFLGFAGFRPISVIRQFLFSIPEVQQLPQSVKDSVKAFVSRPSEGDIQGERGSLGEHPDRSYLRGCWEEFITMEGEVVEKAVNAFTRRVGQEGSEAFSAMGETLDEREKGNLVEAVKSLEQYYPGDGSTFATLLFTNLVELKKGEGLYVGADGPHAWLKGEIVELMAASDNVLNVGFTPDKDSTRLVAKAVTATSKTPEELILRSQPFHKGRLGNTVVYSTPFEEFSILCVKGAEKLAPLSGPGIAIVTEAKETTLWDRDERVSVGEVGRGSVFFVGAGTELDVKGDGEVWMAFYNGDKGSAEEVGEQ